MASTDTRQTQDDARIPSRQLRAMRRYDVPDPRPSLVASLNLLQSVHPIRYPSPAPLSRPGMRGLSRTPRIIVKLVRCPAAISSALAWIDDPLKSQRRCTTTEVSKDTVRGGHTGFSCTAKASHEATPTRTPTQVPLIRALLRDLTTSVRTLAYPNSEVRRAHTQETPK